jgi:two-component system response regulator YesN
MRLKALLVDDEVNILKNLQMVIPWEQMHIDIIGLAKNGIVALELVKEYKPDIILCDIRMPIMDGFQFLERLRMMDEFVEVIMVTGYQDFEYARSAIKFRVRDFILKPINYEELGQTVGRLARMIREHKQVKLLDEKKLSRVTYMAYEKMLYDILMDYSSVHSQYLLHDDEHMNLEQLRYTVLLADFDDYSQKCRSTNEMERKLWNFATRNVLQEALLPFTLQYCVLQMREGEWCILIEHTQTESEFAEEDVRMWTETLQEAVFSNVKIDLSMGIYPRPVTIQKLPDVYKKLQRDVHLTAEKNRSIIVCMDSNEHKDSNDDSIWEWIEMLVSGLKQCNRAKTESALQGFTLHLQALSSQSPGKVEYIAHFVVLHLMREMREMEVLSVSDELAIWSRMEQSHRVKDMLAVIRQQLDVSLHIAMNKKTSDVLMLSAKDYIHHHLSKDLGIDELADYLKISPSYFSLLFKQSFNETFVEYITRQRMELAKSLLLLTDKSVTEIGKSVGYWERRYFSKVFQKYTGHIPSEFREKQKKTGGE